MIKLTSCGLPNFFRGYINGFVHAAVVFQALDRNIVEQLLPASLTLAEQDFTAPSAHPVYWTFNLWERGVTTALPCLTLDYHEAALVIPYVTLKNGDRKPQLAYPVTLHLNSLLGVLGGRVFWQLPKNYTRCRADDEIHGFKGANLRATPLFNASKSIITATFENVGTPEPVTEIGNFQKWRPALDQPLVSTGLFGTLAGRFRLDYQDLSLYSLQGEINTGQYVEGLNNREFAFHSIQQDLFGGFYIACNWTLQLPRKASSFE